MRRYRPSNGTEGHIFTDKFCMNCINCDPNPEGSTQCEILCRTLVYDVDDKEYPDEWQYVDGVPTCTAWVKWDWGDDGDPNDPNNPKAPIEPADNQLMLFSVADDILENHEVKETTKV